MLIECTIKRTGGTKLTIGATNYHFKPVNVDDEEAPHVCEVADGAHAKRLLSIKEAYKASGKVDPTVAKELKQDADEEAAAAAEAKRLADSMNKDVIPVSEDTQIEIVETLLDVMEAHAKEKKITVSTADDLTGVKAAKVLEEISGINVKSKNEIIRYAAGCEVELNKNDNPARMIKDLLNALLARHSEEEDESDLGADADTEEHAEGLTDQTDEDQTSDEDQTDEEEETETE